jgi:hypothetical protein
MAMTNAEKQRCYRERKLKDENGERINLIVSVNAKLALKRLAAHNGLTQSAMLERILLEAQSAITQTLDDDQFKKYINAPVTQ